jgi:thiamine pyrophosphokinase
VRAIIVAGGQAGGNEDWRRWVWEGDWIIGADGGAAQALAWGLVPHLVIGDMDSLPGEARAALEAQGSRFVVHPRAKDETDLELALTYATQRGAREIVVLGALGGRLDHTLANVLLLALPKLDGVVVRIASHPQRRVRRPGLAAAAGRRRPRRDGQRIGLAAGGGHAPVWLQPRGEQRDDRARGPHRGAGWLRVGGA